MPKKRPTWSARFSEPVDERVKRFTASVGFDRRLAKYDIEGSLAHARMLAAKRILSRRDLAAIERGLRRIARDIESGRFRWSLDAEDVHLNIERRLTTLVGDAGKRLHTARSRNDQVATDVRLWLREEIDGLRGLLSRLEVVLLDQAERHAALVMPGFTHLQVAQPVTWGHHMLAYVEMLDRDRGRFRDARVRMNECPLGAAALAGTSFAIDREMTAAALGFDRPMANSLDAVSDRDFALEFLGAAAISAMHLSRLAEEIVIWCSPPWRFIRLSDAFTTGSSIMPQKRNPDAAELVRAKTGRIVGALQALLMVMKGLPLAYQKDMQEDKEGAMDALGALSLSIAAMTGMVRDMLPDAARMRAAADGGYATATDLADWLVSALKIPFRDAHHVTGRIVAKAASDGVALDALPLHEMQAIEPRITKDVYQVLSADNSVKSRVSYGGTAPKNVRREANKWLKALAREG